jgi:hypothetical protein
LISSKKKGISLHRQVRLHLQLIHHLPLLLQQHQHPITAVRVPTDGDHCKKCDSWQTLDYPTEVQEALQHRNQGHFGQAHVTFPTTPQFTDHIDWMASTISSDMILNGEDPFEDIDIPDIA